MLAIVGGMLLTLVVIMALFSIVNATIEFVAYRRLRRAPRLAALITAVGMSFIVQNISLALYGVGFHSIPSFIPRTEAIGIGDITYSWNKLAAAPDHDPRADPAQPGSSARRSRGRRCARSPRTPRPRR